MTNDKSSAGSHPLLELPRNEEGHTLTEITTMLMTSEMRAVMLRSLRHTQQSHRLFLTHTHDHIMESHCAECHDMAQSVSAEVTRIERTIRNLESAEVQTHPTTVKLDDSVAEYVASLNLEKATDADIGKIIDPYVDDCAASVVLGYLVETFPALKEHLTRAAVELQRRDDALENQIKMREMAVEAAENEKILAHVESKEAETPATSGFDLSRGGIVASGTQSRH